MSKPVWFYERNALRVTFVDLEVICPNIGLSLKRMVELTIQHCTEKGFIQPITSKAKTMTNNPTIDGVSRELAVAIKINTQQEEDILRFFDTCEDGQGYDVPKPRMKSLARLGLIRSTGFSRYEITEAGDSVIEKLCEPVDAPAVERQEAFAATDRIENSEEDLAMNASPWSPSAERSGAFVKGWMAKAKLAQSTIAQLQARIAELESGRGEMIYQIEYLNDPGWRDTDQHQFNVVSKLKGYRVRTVFTAPPSPVAVEVVDEQQAFANWTHEVIGMRGLAKVQRRDEMTVEQEKFALKGWLARACLDATAALNGERK